MNGPIVDVPAEIKLAIIEALEAFRSTGTDDSVTKERRSKRSNPGAFKPTRASNDVINLSCTCRLFRSISRPHIFRSIILRNDEKSGTSIQAIADSEHAGYVKELHYEGHHSIPLPENAVEDQYDESMETTLLPRSVSSILRNLDQFPELEKFIIEFPFGASDGQYEDSWSSAFDYFGYREKPQIVLKEESTRGWRAIMVKSFNAIVQNKSHTIKSLELRQLVTKEVSTWNTPEWRELLNGVQEFEISIRGIRDMGAGVCLR
jgi:hypothetical protein